MLIGLIAGCGDDDDNGGGPPPGTPVTLETVWPNEDGRGWLYAGLTRLGWESDLLDSVYIFPDSASVPDAPDLVDIYPLIDNPPLPDTFAIASSEFELEFDGEITTQSGVTGK